jgi:hypothetical protein
VPGGNRKVLKFHFEFNSRRSKLKMYLNIKSKYQKEKIKGKFEIVRSLKKLKPVSSPA